MLRAIAAGVLACVAATTQYGRVVMKTTGLSAEVQDAPFAPVELQEALAWGHYNDSIPTIGWGQLYLSTHRQNGHSKDEVAAYAAGMLEGSLTQARITQFLNNIGANTFAQQQPYGPQIQAFTEANFAWMKQMIDANPLDVYWHQVSLQVEQLQGLYAGYLAALPANATRPEFFTVYQATLMGDNADLVPKFQTESVARKIQAASDGHCSLFVKPVGNPDAPDDLWFGHTTWVGLVANLRIYKTYDFPFRLTSSPHSGTVPGRTIAFSSYPGALFSNDDFYTTSAGLVVSETTIINQNLTLYDFVQPESVLDWARTLLANRLATSGPTWAQLYRRYNSGTYNNAWSVADMKLFKPGQPLRPNTLWLLEQLPGPYVAAEDITDKLRASGPGAQGYWASYNRIMNQTMFNVSGQPQLVKEYGDRYTYLNYSRAVIFRREQGSVQNEQDFVALMRYNRWQTDPIATQGCKDGTRSASNAIAARGDLTPVNAECVPGLDVTPEAAIDLKYTSATWMQQGSMKTIAQSGPTTFDGQPPFRWSTSPFAHTIPHEGCPDLWDFPFVEYTPFGFKMLS